MPPLPDSCRPRRLSLSGSCATTSMLVSRRSAVMVLKPSPLPCSRTLRLWLQELAIGRDVELHAAGKALADQGRERVEVGYRQRRVGAKILALEIGAGVAGQVRRRRHDAQPLDRQLLRPRLRDRNLQPHPVADERSEVARQQARRRLDGAIEGETQAVGERDPDGGIRAREPLGVDLEIALPLVQRPLAGQRQLERPGRGVAAQGGEEPAGLLRLHRQIEGRRVQLQGRIDAGACGRLVDALQRQLRRRRAAIRRVQMAVQREAGGLPEHLLAEIELGDGELLQGRRRQPVRQLRQGGRARLARAQARTAAAGPRGSGRR